MNSVWWAVALIALGVLLGSTVVGLMCLEAGMRAWPAVAASIVACLVFITALGVIA